MSKPSGPMEKNAPRFRSGFPMLDLLTGGYPAGSVIVARYVGHEFQADIVQRFVARQAVAFGVPHGGHSRRTHFITLQMSETELAESLLAEKAVPPEVLAGADISISAIDADGHVPDPGVFLATVTDHIATVRPEAVIIDAIDRLIPEDDAECGNPVSRMLLKELLEFAADHPVPIVVSDYGNVWETDIPSEPRVVEVVLNEDAHGTVQATVRQHGRGTVIENIFEDPESPGFQLVKAVLDSDGYRVPPDLSDEIEILVNSAAVIIRHIDKILRTP